VDYFEATVHGLAVSRCPLTLRRKKLYTSDSRCNVTDKNHHGSFPYQFLSSQAAEPRQKQSKDGSPPGVSILTNEKAPECICVSEAKL
jgi:hypothetical protein